MKGVQGWQVALLALALVTGVGMTFLVPSEENGEKKAKDPMEVEAGFSGSVPQKYTCDGRNISPPVSFSRLPDGTETVALIMDDPDAPTRVFDHWVAWNITSKSIPEGLPARKKLQNGIVQGTNDFDNTGYSGPCPPTGTHLPHPGVRT
ncbi:MAG: YbhB/YbcL family Raf kinase inhibitor-like protein [Candidatus Nanohaloarchaea archaeon]